MGAYDFLIHFNSRPQAGLNLGPTAKSPRQALRMACQEFESLFIEQLLNVMRKAVPKSELFGDRREEEMYVSLFDQELAVKLAQQKGLGLADLMFEQLKAALPQEEGKEQASPDRRPSLVPDEPREGASLRSESVARGPKKR